MAANVLAVCRSRKTRSRRIFTEPDWVVGRFSAGVFAGLAANGLAGARPFARRVPRASNGSRDRCDAIAGGNGTAVPLICQTSAAAGLIWGAVDGAAPPQRQRSRQIHRRDRVAFAVNQGQVGMDNLLPAAEVHAGFMRRNEVFGRAPRADQRLVVLVLVTSILPLLRVRSAECRRRRTTSRHAETRSPRAALPAPRRLCLLILSPRMRICVASAVAVRLCVRLLRRGRLIHDPLPSAC